MNALRAYNRNAKANLKIGPSDQMAKGIRQVIQFEQNYSPETAPRVKKMSRTKKLDLKQKRGR